MQLNQIWPIVVPAVLIQLSIQIYYIWHCWEKSELSTKRKARWIAAIAVFNLIGVVVYLLVTRKKSNLYKENADDKKIDSNITRAVSVILYMANMIFSITIIFNSLERSDIGLIVIMVTVNLLLIFASWVFNENRWKYLHYILPVFSLGAAAFLNYMDDYSITTLIILVVAANIINNHSLKASRIYAGIGFVLYVGMVSAGLFRGGSTVTSDELIGFIYLNSVIYILVYAAFYLLKRQLIMNVRLRELVDETHEKGKSLEKMTAINERNKIAGEIHDTVGHTLTTAMISIDAAIKNIGYDEEKAKETMMLARSQIKKGMDDIRYSVRAIKQGTGSEDFRVSFPSMIEEMEKSTGIKINSIVELKDNLIPIHRSLIYRVIKECVTNSVKHGECSEADVLVSEFNGILNVTYSDDGKGTDAIKEGYGLSNIREMTTALGGEVSYSSATGEGFSMNMQIPTGQGERNE